MNDNSLLFYPGNQDVAGLTVTRGNSLPIKIKIEEWDNKRNWMLYSNGDYKFVVAGLTPETTYNLIVNGDKKQSFTANAEGIVSFSHQCEIPISFRLSAEL